MRTSPVAPMGLPVQWRRLPPFSSSVKDQTEKKGSWAMSG